MNDPNMGPWSYKYNALGELTSQTDAKSQTVTMVYDALGRMTSRAEPEGTTTWTYDTASRGASLFWKGRLHTVQGPSAIEGGVERRYSETLSYDSYGRPSSAYYVYDSHKATNLQVYKYTTSQTYDTKGRPLRFTYPDNFQTENEYNAYGFLTKIKAAGGLSGLSGEVALNHVFWEAKDYSEWGSLQKAVIGNGASLQRGYDPVTGRMTSVKSYRSAGSGTKIVDIAYNYDALGNVVSRTDASYGSTLSETYTYDGLNRLKVYAGGLLNNGTHNYNALGNITSKPGVTGTYTYSATKRYQVTSAGGASYAYDLNGNRTTGDGLALNWNSFNMLRDMTKASKTARFWYGLSRQRIVQHDQVNDELTHYVGDLYEFKANFSQSGDRSKCYIRTPSGRVAVRVLTKTGFTGLGVKTRYFHADA